MQDTMHKPYIQLLSLPFTYLKYILLFYYSYSVYISSIKASNCSTYLSDKDKAKYHYKICCKWRGKYALVCHLCWSDISKHKEKEDIVHMFVHIA